VCGAVNRRWREFDTYYGGGILKCKAKSVDIEGWQFHTFSGGVLSFAYPMETLAGRGELVEP
jgi:hypothetical protein